MNAKRVEKCQMAVRRQQKIIYVIPSGRKKINRIPNQGKEGGSYELNRFVSIVQFQYRAKFWLSRFLDLCTRQLPASSAHLSARMLLAVRNRMGPQSNDYRAESIQLVVTGSSIL